jgi:hypothetical protein
MVWEGKMKKETTSENDGKLEKIIKSILAPVVKSVEDLGQHVLELESRKDLSGQAKLVVVERTLNTDKKHLRELSILPPRAIKPLKLAAIAGSVLDDDVQNCQVSLAENGEEAFLMLLRSKGGYFLGKAMTLTEQIEAAKAEGDLGEEIKVRDI